MAYIKCFLFCIIFSCKILYAQSVLGPIGAEAWGMGGANVASTNSFAVQNNVGAMAWIKNPEVSIYNEAKYSLSNLVLSNINIVLPFKRFHLGAGVNYFGYSLYNQQKINVAIAKQLNKQFSVGISMAILVINIAENSQAYTYFGDIGVLYKPTKKLNIGVGIYNPSQSKISNNNNYKIPTSGRLGVAFEATDKLLLMAEFEKTFLQTEIYMAGLAYKLHKQFTLRTGYASNPFLLTFGAGYTYNKLKIDMAVSYHQVLGTTPRASISYLFAN